MLKSAGFTLIEVLLATLILLLAAAAFATLATQSARSTSSSQVSSYAADVLAKATTAINEGNPTYLQSRDLSSADFQRLGSGNRRTTLRPALTGRIQSLGGDPPRYRVQISGQDFTLESIATAPGGTP